MTEWVRLLSRVTTASAEWHVPQTKSFSTTTYCGTKLEGPLEVTSDDEAEREGRCSSCVTYLATTLGLVPQRPSWPTAQTLRSSLDAPDWSSAGTLSIPELNVPFIGDPAPSTRVKRAAAKKTAGKKTIRKPAPKGRSGKAPVVKRRVRRSRRGKA